MSGWIDPKGWIHCPTCGNKTRTKVNPDTVLKHFPLFCPKCGKELIKDGYTLPEETYTNYDFGKELDISLNLPPEFICTAHEILRKNANGKIIDYGQIQTMPPEFAYNLVIEYARKRKLKIS